MARERVTRKLAAILAADMVGYSRLMEKDEEGTIARHKTHRAELIDPKIVDHGGRIVKSTGDGLLVEFASAVDAVNCAAEIQRAMTEREANVPDHRRIAYRVGINIGDIVIDGEDILGDGVNIAARLETLAEPDGICISDVVFKSIRGKLDLGFAHLGPQKVKNLAEPVPAFKVLLAPEDSGKLVPVRLPLRKLTLGLMAVALIGAIAAGTIWWRPWVTKIERASIQRMAFALPKKPSIAVLPFGNLTGRADQDIMIEGLVENIITTLSAIPSLFVIARSSTFTYKGKAVKVRQVAEELGVRYVLVGSVQSSGGKARITVRLVDAVAGNQLWAKRYDRELKNVFAIEDEISWAIATALEVKLVAGEKAREQRATTNNPEAYALLRRGRMIFVENFSENALKARSLYEQALRTDPRFVAAMVEIARTYLGLARDMPEPDRSNAIVQAEKYLQKAGAINASYAGIYEVSGQLLNLKGEYLQARRMLEKAVEMEPSNAEHLRRLAKSFGDRGEPKKAISLMKEAMRLNPYYNRTYTRYLAVAYRRDGRLNKALEVARRLLDYRPVYVAAHRELAVTFAMMGETGKAREHAKTLLRLKPDFTVRQWARSIGEVIHNDRQRELDALRSAGIPEGG